ncbi:class I lanthipeptide [Taibaiella koreensis]|uniref:class I lanthipeptide n=1 Tax=Taibaiella koreensis TaxID=1268548 RepID=UPI000E5A0369|nr:class I lanthipeptide [Taibaiella koreensis]
MKKKNQKKLSLNRVVIAKLDNSQQESVAGGFWTLDVTLCAGSCLSQCLCPIETAVNAPCCQAPGGGGGNGGSGGWISGHAVKCVLVQN